MCATTPPSTSNASSSGATSGTDEKNIQSSGTSPSRPQPATRSKSTSSTASLHAPEEELPPPYTLRDHCRYLKLKTEQSGAQSYWYCDWTSKFVSTPASQQHLIKDVVKDYCQPFGSLAELQDSHVGISCLSPSTEDPLAVRTVSIRLRPDAHHYKIMEALHQAFVALHAKDFHIIASTPQTFQAIGANGSTPYFVSAFCGTHRQSLERRLWIRFYHVESIHIDENSHHAQAIQALLERVSAETNDSRMAPLRNVLTPINTQLAEACVLIQFVLEGELEPTFPCPEPTQEETTRFFQTTYKTSISALEESKNLARHRNVRNLFPSLSNQDYPILQESFALMDRIWSELELYKCTYNTLVEETSRFGMRPCQSTLDKDYCFALSEISQQRMLLDLQTQVSTAESILHDTLSHYHEVEKLLVHVLRRKYNIPQAGGNRDDDDTAFSSLDIDQTPVKIPKRKLADFPWHDSVKEALGHVSSKIAMGCLVAFDAQESVQMAEDAVHHVFTAFGKRDDTDQQVFLKQRNRQAMIRVAQQQAVLKRLLEKIILAPLNWPALPKLQSHVKLWYEMSLQSKTSNTRRNPVPLLEFRTSLGQGCLTAHQLMIVSGLLTTTVKVYDLVDVDVLATPKHPLTTISILENGERIGGFNPLEIKLDKFVQTISILKQMQEA